MRPINRGRYIQITAPISKGSSGGGLFDESGQGGCFGHRGDTQVDLWIRDLLPIGLCLLARVIRDIQSGVIVSVPQNETLATWEPSFGRPPLFRPDLPRIGAAPEGFEVKVTADALHFGGR